MWRWFFEYVKIDKRSNIMAKHARTPRPRINFYDLGSVSENLQPIPGKEGRTNFYDLNSVYRNIHLPMKKKRVY